jgi:HEAT repeat protein
VDNPTPLAAAALCEATRDSASSVRFFTWHGLEKIGKQFVGVCASSAIHSRGAPFRAEAVSALRDAEDAERWPLLALAMTDLDVLVRREAAMVVKGSGDPKTGDLLRLALTDDDPEVRTRAVWGLLESVGARAFPEIAARARDESFRVREAVAYCFAQIGTRRAKSLLRSLSSDSSEVVRMAAFDALSLDASLDELARAGEDSEASIRQRAVLRLAELGDGRAIELIQRSLLDPDPTVQATAIHVLAKVRGKDSIPEIRHLLEDEQPGARARCAALLALRLLDHAVPQDLLWKLFDTQDRWLRAEAIRSLVSFSEPGVLSRLTEIACGQTEDDYVRAAAAETLLSIDAAVAIPTLTALLADRDLPSLLRIRIEDALEGRSLDERLAMNPRLAQPESLAFEELIAIVSDPDRRIRRLAVRELHRRRDRRATSSLLKTLEDRDFEISMIAGDAVGAIGDPRSVQWLLAMLGDPYLPGTAHWPVEHALSQLGNLALGIAVAWTFDLVSIGGTIGPPDAYLDETPSIAGLLFAIGYPDARVRSGALKSLRQLRGGDRVGSLISLLRHADPDVRQAACCALASHQLPNAIAALAESMRDPVQSVARAAAAALARIGNAAIAVLISRLEDPSASVRRHASWSLGRVGDTRAVAGLSIAACDSDVSVGRTAIWALVNIGGIQVLQALDALIRADRSDAELAHVIARARSTVNDQW